MFKAVIFDLDGVLVDSIDAVTKYLRDVLIASGYTAPSETNIRSVFHLPRPEALKALTRSDSPIELKRLLKISNKVPFLHHLMKTTDGAKEVVKELSSLYPLAIVTSKMRPNTEEYLKRSGLKIFFPVVVTHEDTEKHKPHPEPLILAASRLGFKPEECIYVGDSNSDVEAARACAMKVMGYSDNITLQADFRADTFADILFLFKNVG